ncbi:MAG: hypothetical protein HY774_25575 [Acidobacteria bacterium]|nr:hypothetical protein [Acidobacteriota bacterium]
MANRAYLFCTDVIEESIWWNRDRKYYDSRWQIPLAWFFFFSAGDLHWWERQESGDSWKEVKLWTEKENALKRFSQRRKVLEPIIKDRLDVQILDRFKREIISLKGIYLVLDPEEIIGGISYPDLEHFNAIKCILETIDHGDASTVKNLSGLGIYFQFSDDPGRWELNVIGCTY